MKIEKVGVSMGLCAGEMKKYLREKDSVKAFLVALEDFSEFAKENSFGIIEIDPFVIEGEKLLSRTKEIKDKISQFEMIIYHLPLGEINISALNSGIRIESLKETKKHIDLCQKIGIDKVVMHPGSYATMPDRYLLLEEQTRNIARKSIFEIFKYCKKRNIELSVENLPRNHSLFQKPEEFKPYIETGIGMVLDTVHAFEAHVDALDFVKEFGNKITEVHLTDGVIEDPIKHYPLGEGQVDCLRILKELNKIDYRGRIILEVESKKDLLKSKKYLEENFSKIS